MCTYFPISKLTKLLIFIYNKKHLMFTFYVLNLTDPNVFPPAANFQTIADIINILIPTAMIGAGVILFVMIAVSGLSILQSGGNPEKLKKAQGTLTASIAGFAIIIVSYIIIKLLDVILGLNLPFL